MSETISTKALAEALGISRQRVNQLEQKGKLKREPDGKWDLSRVREALGRNLDIHQKSPALGQVSKSRRPGRREDRPGNVARPGDVGDPEPTSIAEAQLKHEIAKAARAEFEVAKLRGIMVDAYEAACEWGAHIVTVRNRALGIPSKIAPKVACVSDVLECQEILDREIRSFLSELSEYRPNV